MKNNCYSGEPLWKCRVCKVWNYANIYLCPYAQMPEKKHKKKMFLLQQEVLLYPIFHDTVLYHV